MSLLRFFRRAKWDKERREELESYIHIETDENIARGMTPHAARAAAHRKLGNAVRIREEIYTMNTIGFLDSLGRDVRYAVRAMFRSPMFTLIAVLTLGIGIGANTSIFSVVNGVLIKPLPYPNPDELVGISHNVPGIGREFYVSPGMYFTYREENRTFQHMGFYSPRSSSVTGLGDPEQVRTVQVTHGTLQALNVQPMMGRWFSEADDTPSPDSNPAILTYGYWQRRFGGDENVIGRVVTIDSRPSEIVGVMPQHFRFLNADPEVILTLRFDRRAAFLGNFSYLGLARLKPGVTLPEANADVARMIPIWVNAWRPAPGADRSGFESRRLVPALRPLKQDVVGDIGNTLWVLMGTIGMVLLIAVANIANLLLVRAESRQHEIAIRAALGAGWGRIAREMLVESFMLGLMGGILGLGLAYAGLKLLVWIAPANLPRLNDISMDPFVMVFALAASFASSSFFGSIPALKYAMRMGLDLRGSGRTSSDSRERHRARNVLVVVQVALALVLLVSSGLMIRTFQVLRSIHPGFVRAGEVQTLRISIPSSQLQNPEAVTRMQNAILDKLAAIPGVTSAGFANSVPMDGSQNWDPVFAEDKTYEAGKMPPMRRFKYVSPGYFQALGSRMIAGREITWAEIYDRRPVAVVSESLARELWGDAAAAIGKRVKGPGAAVSPWREVVGVSEDVREDGLHQRAPAAAYWPVLMNNFFGPVFTMRNIAIAVRSERAGTEAFLREVQQAVWSVNPNLPLAQVRTMQDLYDRSLARTSFTLVLLAIAGAMALILGIIGIYGVIAYVVSQRTREIGIRVALGAQHHEVTSMFVRHGMVLTVVGAAVGLGAAAALTRLMSSLLFGISPLDPITYGTVLVVLLAAAALASYLPARRASRVDPVNALRSE